MITKALIKTIRRVGGRSVFEDQDNYSLFIFKSDVSFLTFVSVLGQSLVLDFVKPDQVVKNGGDVVYTATAAGAVIFFNVDPRGYIDTIGYEYV